MRGDIPYWGAGGVLDRVDRPIFDEPLVLLGEDGAPFFTPGKDVAYYIEGPSWVNNHIHALRPERADGRFLAYSLNAVDYANYITGSTRDKLTQDDLKEIQVANPPLEEQRRIADFLDAETARIDKLISLRDDQIGLLREHFDSLVVNKLLPSSPPESWTAARVKHMFEFSKGGVWGDDPTGDGEDVRCVRVADFDRQAMFCDPDPPTRRHVPQSLRRGRLLKRGDVLLEKSGGGDKSPVGFAVGFDSRYESVCSNFVAVLRPTGGVHARYVGLLMAALYKSGRNIPFIKQTTGIQNLDMEAYLAQSVHIAESDKQRAVADYLDEERERVSRTSTKLQSQKRLLAERRQALITAAVTGEFEVSAASGRGIEE